jgi:hypothetical protein
MYLDLRSSTTQEILTDLRHNLADFYYIRIRVDVAALLKMENEDNVNLPPQQHPHLKIPAFWASNPEAWFVMVEGQFVLKGITQDTMKFYHVLGSLPETAVRGLGDLMHGPPPEDAYIQLKAWLLATHTLTEFQRMEKLLAAQALGGQKPSDMLHDLVLFCPDSEAQTRIFRYLFLQRLPTEIRIILAEDRDSMLAALAARANQLWAHSTRQQHNTAINAVLDEEGHETIAAVSSSHHVGVTTVASKGDY